LKKKNSKALLLALLDSLADFDGQLSKNAIALLQELQQRFDPIPPLYADVFGLPASATCADLAKRVTSLSQQQVAIASYAFQIFRSYEHMLRVDTTTMAPKQKAAYDSQMERIRLLISRSRTAIAESIGSSKTE
jgi:hypothetical protein